MSGKRQRVAVELPAVGQAALPAVCYVPSILAEGADLTGNPTAPVDGALHSLAKRLKYSVHAKARLGHTIQLVHASLGDIEYVGRSDGDENSGVQPCCYALGVYRPVEGKLQLVSVAGDRLFRLDTRLPGLVYAPTAAGAEEDANVREVKKQAAKRLVDVFGSTRRRRQLTARDAGVVAADKISGGEAVKDILGGVASRGQVEGLTREEMTRRAFAQRTVPPHDPAATSAAAAYPLDLLLGRGDRAGGHGTDGVGLVRELNAGQIHKLAEDDEERAVALEKKWVHPYVLGRLGPLRSLKASDDPADRSRAKSRARYLALLAALLRLQARKVLTPKDEGVSGLVRELRVREGLAELFLDRFYVRTEDALRGVRYERPEAQKKLLQSYILAVAVVTEEGFMDKEQFEELREALELDASKLANAMQELGCNTKSIKYKVERSGGQLVEVPSFTASLLRQDPRRPDKTLAQCFPAIRLSKGKSGGR